MIDTTQYYLSMRITTYVYKPFTNSGQYQKNSTSKHIAQPLFTTDSNIFLVDFIGNLLLLAYTMSVREKTEC